MERKNEGNARSDESEGEDRREQGRTQTKHEWDGMSDGDDKDRPQMSDDDANDSQALTGGDITRYRAQVCCAIASPRVLDMERTKRIGRYLA